MRSVLAVSLQRANIIVSQQGNRINESETNNPTTRAIRTQVHQLQSSLKQAEYLETNCHHLSAFCILMRVFVILHCLLTFVYKRVFIPDAKLLRLHCRALVPVKLQLLHYNNSMCVTQVTRF